MASGIARTTSTAGQAPGPGPGGLLEVCATYQPGDKLRLIEDAYWFAAESHAPQKRLTGEPYIIHPLDAAMTVASLQMDPATIAAALLHDVQEDCGVPSEELAKRFGPEVG